MANMALITGSYGGLGTCFTNIHVKRGGDLAEYFGFTEQEVSELCGEYGMSFEEAKIWYDGYQLIAHIKGFRSSHADRRVCPD